MTNTAHLNKYLSTQAFIVELLETIIQRMKPGERLPFTELCATHAATFGIKGPQLAPYWKAYAQGHPDVQLRAGRYGGLYKTPKAEEVVAKSEKPVKAEKPTTIKAEVISSTPAPTGLARVAPNYGSNSDNPFINPAYSPSAPGAGLMIVPAYHAQFMQDDSAE
jgi:hypothetical protein